MEENPNRMLEKLDIILRLVQDCKSILKRIESQGESWHINSIPSDDVKELEVVDEAETEPEPDSEVVDAPDPEPKVKESLIETHVDLLAKPIMELLQFSPAMRVSLSLRPSNVYDPLQIFLNEACS